MSDRASRAPRGIDRRAAVRIGGTIEDRVAGIAAAGFADMDGLLMFVARAPVVQRGQRVFHRPGVPGGGMNATDTPSIDGGLGRPHVGADPMR
ncbi:hypothetical protein DLJ53_22510 [Acuticoccus sediminis]|uniref:Uncharacterized protein n=1 Tax=Acuticoccus sediminis TaxID=2184697 RepID=A0A8B2NQN2_9HYPH|nr:hypothetical protein DLJ53_22510 [Acuticoccus sediminis]